MVDPRLRYPIAMNPVALPGRVGRSHRLLVAVASLWLLPRVAHAQAMPPALAQFLTQLADFKGDEIAQATSGVAVVKIVPTAENREVALIGVTRVDVPREFYVSRVKGLDPSATANTSGFGVFGDPPSPQDLAGLSLSRNEMEDLSRCRPGACKLKLPGTLMGEARALIDSSGASRDSAVRAYLVRRVLNYVAAYRERGNDALVVYNDRKEATEAARVWDGLLSTSPYIYRAVPGLDRYLRNYPRDRPPGARDMIFWTDDAVPGAATLMTITHQVVYDPPELPGTTVIAAKQLFCDHYLDGGLDLMGVEDVENHDAKTRGVYVLLIRRLHFDDLPSGGLINIRGKVVSRFRDLTLTFLKYSKASSERAFGDQPPS